MAITKRNIQESGEIFYNNYVFGYSVLDVPNGTPSLTLTTNVEVDGKNCHCVLSSTETSYVINVSKNIPLDQRKKLVAALQDCMEKELIPYANGK